MLHFAEESQPAQNSCPRLPHSVDSRFGLSCRCRVKFSTQSDQPCRNLSHTAGEALSERGTFFRVEVYKRVGISRAEV